jgi:hypothetical protein
LKHRQRTNLDKTIQELTNRLDEVHPYSASSSTNNHQIRSDGINYWKGIKIISTKAWNELYEKSSTYTNNYKTILTSRKPLLYFPNDYNGSISTSGIIDEKLKVEIQYWNNDYNELLEYRKNPTLGRMKCRGCLLSGSHDDPIFVGIEKVFARIVSNQCNNNINTQSHGIITYHCNVMNIFSCPFESIKSYNEKEIGSKYPYKRDDLFILHQISFAIEQAITTFFELTKQNEIIYEVDFENDMVHEIHTKYNGEPESWGWQENVKEQLSKVKPISNIVIRDENDIYNILTNKEKLEYLLEEYGKKNSRVDRELEQVCYDENTPCVPANINENEDGNSNNKKVVLDTTTTEPLASTARKIEQQVQQPIQDGQQQNHSHKGKNRHSKTTGEDDGLDIEHLKPELKSKIKEELEKSYREQQILLKNNKQSIIDFIIGNKESIRVEDLKIYEPIYKCYREKENCQICNSLSNIICISCDNYNNKIWLCTNHWQEHVIENHHQKWTR